MGGESNGPEADLYVISWGLDRAKIGVAGDARKRLRELQVGSPVELELALTQPFAHRRDADAVAEELHRCFAGRRVRGSWYRLTAAEVRERLGTRATAAAEVGVTSRTLRNWKTAPPFRRERERRRKRAARQRAAASHRKAKPQAWRDPEDERPDRAGPARPAAQPQHERPPTPPGQQQTSAAAPEQPPSGLRQVDSVPLWGDSDPTCPRRRAARRG